MIGAIPYTFNNYRMFASTKHGTDLLKLKTFAEAIQQEFTIANIPFCELRERENIGIEAPLTGGYGLRNEVIITFKVGGERFGFQIYAPRTDILTPRKVRKHTQYRVTDAMLDRFAEIYPAENVSVETGWLVK